MIKRQTEIEIIEPSEAEIEHRSIKRYRSITTSDNYIVFCSCGDLPHWLATIAECHLEDYDISYEYIGTDCLIGLLLSPGVTEAETIEAERLYSNYYRSVRR